jgi:hypothetical protein
VKFRCCELSCITGSRARLPGLGLTRTSWTDLFPCETLPTITVEARPPAFDPAETNSITVLDRDTLALGGAGVERFADYRV